MPTSGGHPNLELLGDKITVFDLLASILLRYMFPTSVAAVDEFEKQRAFQLAPVSILTQQEMAQALVQNQIELAEAQAEAEKSGYTAERLDILERIAGDPPGPETLLDLWNRGVLSAEQVEQGLRESRLKNKYNTAVMELRNKLLTPEQLAQALVQNQIEEQVARKEAVSGGINEDRFNVLANVAGEPPGIETLLEMWRRNIVEEPIVDQGIRESRLKNKYIEAVKQLRFHMPSPQDVVRFQVREAYSDEIVQKFDTDAEYPSRADADFAQLGVSSTLAHLFWRAHWELPSITEGFEMLHRGIINQDTLDLLLQVRDIMPFWRPLLSQMSYIPLTRVDIRRMWDLHVVSDDDVVRTYQDQGYSIDNARKLLLFTKLERTVPELRRRYQNGWIHQDDVTRELTQLGLDSERTRRVVESIVKQDKSQRTVAERHLTKSEIIKLLKREKIKLPQAILLLQHMGYDAAEARLIIEANINLQESPDTPLELLQSLNILNAVHGGPQIEVPQEVLVAEKRYLESIGTESEAHNEYAYNLMLAKYNLQNFKAVPPSARAE